MKCFALITALAALASASPTNVVKKGLTKRKGNLPPVTVKGNAFFADGKRWYVRGIAWQPGGASANLDPLADEKICERDIAAFKDLGLNTVRVYSVDNTLDHDHCMKLLDDAGIYLTVDVSNPKYSINRADPHPSYNAAYLQSIFATVEMFAQYDNVAMFYSGNEVIDSPDTDVTAPYIKAVTRDLKNYMASRGLRQVPVGYSAADVASNRMQTAMYMNCGSDDARADFFAFNDYSWCNTDFQRSGWDQKVKNFTDYGIPIFLSEYGCIDNRPRKFEEMDALMSDQMTGVYSGGLMYEYTVEDNEFGIVTIKNGNVDKGDEYPFLKSAMEEFPAPTSGNGGAASTTHSVDCPSKAPGWEVDPDWVPVMPVQAQKYMDDGAGDGPGLNGDGSQQDTDSGTATASATSGEASPTQSGAGKSGDDNNDDDDDSAGVSLQSGMDFAPMMVTGVALFFTLTGALVL